MDKEKGKKDSETSLGDILDSKDKAALESYLRLLAAKYNLPPDRLKITLEGKDEDSIPCSIFSKEIGVLESIVIYLRVYRKLSNSEIAEILHRSRNNIAVTYLKASSKLKCELKISDDIGIPFSVFTSCCTAFESIVVYLKENRKLSLKEISEKTHRSSQEIWATYRRAHRKHGTG